MSSFPPLLNFERFLYRESGAYARAGFPWSQLFGHRRQGVPFAPDSVLPCRLSAFEQRLLLAFLGRASAPRGLL
jgi:hypothetical protein